MTSGLEWWIVSQLCLCELDNAKCDPLIFDRDDVTGKPDSV